VVAPPATSGKCLRETPIKNGVKRRQSTSVVDRTPVAAYYFGQSNQLILINNELHEENNIQLFNQLAEICQGFSKLFHNRMQPAIIKI
jgi:hypothetical protein